MKKIILLLFSTIFFCSCYVSKNLKSEQINNSWFASFDGYNGKEKIKFKSQENKLVYLSSQLENSSGKLELLNKNEVIPKINKVNHNKFPLNKNVEIQIIGTHAKGSFALKYPVLEIKKIKVNYNPNVELLALSNFLINYEDFNGISEKQTFNINGKDVKVKDFYALTLKIANEFKPYLKSKNLETIKSYLDKDFYLHFSNFVLSLDNFPNAIVKPDNKFLSHFSSLDDAKHFVTAFNDFCKEIRFENYLEKYKPYYEEMISEVSKNIPKENFITEMEHFYGKEIENYNLYPSLTVPFSQGFAVGNDNMIGNVFGSFNVPEKIENPSSLNLGFDNTISLRTVCIHEFGHCFVNPVVDKVDEKIIQSKEYLFDPIKSKMSEQGYNQWKICLYEHFNRAGEVVIARLIKDDKKAEQILKDNVENRSYIYLPQIVEKLEYWYNNEYFTKTYDQKISEIISQFH
ncbi:DUF4932 domain-containing protein [Pedobacter punctiformis]|uniref:DUF4932 domain-containing protein n=1 Tax=Pedobacter punctiformis TaxID=3004097 RepID=A0ABT4L8M6_9SPHI|nr:DUF4932 domain-containing protein [Pedobacter sp. HCMS5-2]MCZ4244265.1 DUF4932 domain-containing protein [Pedobacter sp. HCMS5-2]